mmetsp:Transcript_28107/g.40240  ORF Transcript_28107/g.40240 Transcript_28107/m.40240 type:complete len:191 (+) Transcript_28107:117-689(+)
MLLRFSSFNEAVILMLNYTIIASASSENKKNWYLCHCCRPSLFLLSSVPAPWTKPNNIFRTRNVRSTSSVYSFHRRKTSCLEAGELQSDKEEKNVVNKPFEFEEEEMSDEIFELVEANAPPITQIMKDLLGINIFTYILASLIAIFLALNVILGPGWLGQLLGIEGTGTYTEISDSFPSIVNLDSPENLL